MIHRYKIKKKNNQNLINKIKMSKKKQKYYYGCIPSKLDGTEYKIDIDTKTEIPDEFILSEFMPPVRNQGTT